MKIQDGQRPVFRFWLRRSVEYENAIIELIERIPNRKWSLFIRDAIRLLYDLRYRKRVDVLIELFGEDVYNWLGAQTDKSLLVQRFKKLEQTVIELSKEAQPVQTDLSPILEKLERFMQMVQSGQLGIVNSDGKAIAGANTVAMPTYNDDDDEEDQNLINNHKKVDEGAGLTAIDNFLNGMLNIQDIEEKENTQTRPIRTISG